MMLPARLKRAVIRRIRRLSLAEKIEWDIFPRPDYAYAIYFAALQAKALDIPAISILEFGVAGGNGLLHMESISKEVERELSIRLDIYGFDTGLGQPPPADYRDAPFAWKEGQFKMDEASLRRRLTKAKLILGDIAETAPRFIHDEKPSPIGFIAWDLDYYSSTKNAMRLIQVAPEETFLPRAYCYFDDIIGDDHDIHCDGIGELLAIREFNDEHAAMRLSPIHGLSYKRHIPDRWHLKLYVLHRFKHQRYNDFIHPSGTWQMPIDRIAV